MNRSKITILVLTFFVILVVLFLLLNNKYCIIGSNSNEVNRFLTSIVSLFSVVLLVLTLMDNREFNRRQISITEYNIVLKDFQIIKESLENLRFNIDKQKFSANFKEEIDKATGVDYINFLFQFLHFELKGDEDEREYMLSELRRSFIFPLVRQYNNLIEFLEQVIGNDVLHQVYKNKFYYKTEMLLQHYLRICNYIDPSSGRLEYKIEIFDSNAYSATEFKSLNELFIKKKLWQKNDLEYYKRTN